MKPVSSDPQPIRSFTADGAVRFPLNGHKNGPQVSSIFH
jgi:hypothetical protein